MNKISHNLMIEYLPIKGNMFLIYAIPSVNLKNIMLNFIICKINVSEPIVIKEFSKKKR